MGSTSSPKWKRSASPHSSSPSSTSAAATAVTASSAPERAVNRQSPSESSNESHGTASTNTPTTVVTAAAADDATTGAATETNGDATAPSGLASVAVERTDPTPSSSSSSPPPSTSNETTVSPIRLNNGSSSPLSSPGHSSTATAVAAAQQSSSPSSSASSSSASPSSPHAPSPRRVKLYRLKDDAWEDLGTGTCAVHFVESAPVMTSEGESHHANQAEDGSWIIVRKEVTPGSGAHAEEGELLLKSKVMPYPPGYMSDDDDDLELDGDGRDAVEGKVIDAGGYQRQQDTLIVWTEREIDQEMALSFATAQGCHEIWEFIKAARKWSLDQPLTSPSPSPSRGSSPHAFQIYSLQTQPKLPEPTLGNLAEVEATIRAMSRTAVGRERTASTIVKNEYIQKLIRVHSEAEDLESLEDLHALCRVMQTILLLNDNVIFELVLRDEIILGVASILEYDPEFPTMKASYRAHLADPSHFTQVVQIRSPSLLAKIHQTHRLHYLKDVVLARVLEDSTFSMLNSAIYFNEVDIVNEIAGDPHFLRELFALFDEEEDNALDGKADKGKGKALDATKSIGPQMPSSSTALDRDATAISPSQDRQLDAILFLQQFALMAKNLQLALRAQFFRSLADRGLLRVLEVALARSTQSVDAAPQLRSATIAILMTVVDHDPNNVRSYSLKQQAAGKRPLMGFLIDLFLSEEDLGLKAQMSEALRVLVDAGGEGGPLEAPPRMRQEDPEAEKFLQYFYDHCVQSLLAPILKLPERPASSVTPLELPTARIALCSHLCDLLCFFIAHHTFRSKYFVLSSSVATNVAKLFQTRHKHLRLAALRFFRACVQRNDDFYNRFLIKNDLLRPILDLAVSERHRDNLLGSACLEFFEFVKSVNAKAVINHIVERYGEKVKLLATTLKTFENLVIKYEQNNEPPPTPSATTMGSTSGTEGATSTSTGASGAAGGVSMARENSSSWASRMDVEEEESYFNGSDDDEPGPTTTSTSTTMTSKKRQPGDDEDAEGSPERQKRAKLDSGKSSASGGATMPLVDYGEEEEEPSVSVEGEGGFIKEDPPVSPASSKDGQKDDVASQAPPPPPLLSLAELKKKKEEEEDGELGLLSSKKKALPTTASSNATAKASGGGTGAAGGIKISLGGVKSSLSKLSGGGGGGSTSLKKKE